MRLNALHAATVVALAATAGITQPVRVIDGDTLRIGDERVRIAGIDTPGSKCGCAAACRIADAARERLRQFLAAGEVTVARLGDDKLRRRLATVRVNGEDIGDRLVAEGLARRQSGLAQRARWCGASASR